jgi:hypothetical protein
MVDYPYKWSFNLSIEPSCIMMIVIWRGNHRYLWQAKRPFTIDYRYGVS